MPRSSLCCAVLVVFLLSAARAMAADGDGYRVGFKALPGTGVLIPHQQISDYDPSVPFGVGVELSWIRSFSLSLDVTTSWHSGGPGNDGDLQVSSLQILGRWRFPRRRWTPFAQGGIGFYQAEVDEGQGDDQFGNLGLSFGGGAEVPVWKQLHVQGEVRSNWAKGKESAGSEDLRIGHTQLLMWFVYKLP